jgi:methyl-accepting chemotaxis protein
MEHVAKTLLDAAGKVESMRDATEAEKVSLKKWIDDVLRIQISQLESVIAQTKTAAEGISGHLSRISDLSEAQLEDSSIILEEEESGGLKIEKIMAELESLLALNARCKSMTTDMLQAVSDTSGRIETMSTHVANIVSISDNISLLATNALIKVAHTGDSGRTLAVLANKIRVLSLQAKDKIKKGAEKINAILASSAQFRGSLSEVLHKRLATADTLGEEARATAPQLIAADNAMIVSMNEIAKGTNNLKTDIERVMADIRFDEAINAGLGTIVAKLQAVLKDVEEAIQEVPGGEPHAAPQAELKDLAKRYTMEHERKIHEAAVAKALDSSRALAPAVALLRGKSTGAAKGEPTEKLDSNIELF